MLSSGVLKNTFSTCGWDIPNPQIRAQWTVCTHQEGTKRGIRVQKLLFMRGAPSSIDDHGSNGLVDMSVDIIKCDRILLAPHFMIHMFSHWRLSIGASKHLERALKLLNVYDGSYVMFMHLTCQVLSYLYTQCGSLRWWTTDGPHSERWEIDTLAIQDRSRRLHGFEIVY